MNWKRISVIVVVGLLLTTAVGVGALVTFTDLKLSDDSKTLAQPTPPDNRQSIPGPKTREVPAVDGAATDSDDDGLSDRQERSFGSDPEDPDTDNDGVNDSEEYRHFADPTKADTDDDGVPDRVEIQEGTAPYLEDTDGDSLTDFEELNQTDRFPNADPLEKDLYVVLAWTENADPYTDAQKEDLKRLFSQSDVRNPDGSTGIDVHFIEDTPAHGQQDFETKFNGSSEHLMSLKDRTVSQMSEENRGDYHVLLVTTYTLDAATEGRGVSLVPGNFGLIKQTADNRSRVAHHELLHQIVGEMPAGGYGHSRFHAEHGALSHNLDEPWLNWPVIEKLEQTGFRA